MMTWDDLKQEAGREVSMRKRVYARKVALATMEPKEAHERTMRMSVIYRILKELEVAEQDMFKTEEIREFVRKVKEDTFE